MFKQVISSTQLTTSAANSFFNNIQGGSFQGDESFLATLRALVAPRMKEGESIFLYFHQTNGNANHYTAPTAVRAICDMDCLPHEHGSITIHNFYGSSSENNNAWMEFMNAAFTSVHQEWHRLDKVTTFFKKTFYTLCFINPEQKSVVLFVENLDIRKLHYLQCSIFAFLPWYFDPKLGVSKIEMELIESLREKTSEKYEDCISRIAEQYNFRTARIRQLLAGFETRYEKLECERIRNEIQLNISNINDLNNEIGRVLKVKNNNEIRLLGLEAKIANGSEESEIMDYFLCNDKLILESVSDDSMIFIVKTYLEYFDEDLAERVINNERSFVYRPTGRGCNNIIPADDMRMLMTALFLDRILRVRVCAAYLFNINGNVSAVQNYVYGAECRDCTPNVHIDRYRCLGNYQRTINELLSRNDYIGAIEQCSASCKSLNFNDSPVMSEFMSRMYGISSYQEAVNMRCIELPDGSVVAPKDAIKWLKEQEVHENEQDD